MKIAVLTTFDVYNYGASLQAYALMHYLSSLGHEVELIDYQPEYLTRKYNYKWVNPESSLSRTAITRGVYRVMKFLQRQTIMQRKHAFDTFHQQYLKRTAERYLTEKQLSACPPDADLYIVGSDQVWNVFYETGRDPAFYLDFVKEGRKISYAASFSYLDIDADNMSRIAGSLSTFDGISVRERQGLDILRRMNIEGELVLDPVFLPGAGYWRSIIPDLRIGDKYLLIYDFEDNPELRKFSIRYAKENDLKIYSVNDTYPRRYADRNFSNTGPFEFVSLIAGCEVFVSNSFHGTAFSLIMNKPVFVFRRHRHKVNSRMESLMELFGLSDRILDKVSDYQSSVNQFDFDRINKIIDREVEKSRYFLSVHLDR